VGCLVAAAGGKRGGGTDLEVGHELAALGIYALKEVDLLL
jgi:hypothetical protein